MQLFLSKIKTVKGVLYLIIWGLYWLMVWALIAYATPFVLPGGENQEPYALPLYIMMIAATVFIMVVCVRIWLTNTKEKKAVKRPMRWWHFAIMGGTVVYCFLFVELINNLEKLSEMQPLYVAANLVGAAIMMFIVLLLFNSFTRTLTFMVIFTMVFGLVFYFVYMFRGEPFQFIDFFSAGTAMEVVGGYDFKLTPMVGIFLPLTLSLIALFIHLPDRYWAKTKKRKIIMRCTAGGLLVGGYFFFMFANWNGALGIVTDLWDPHKTYEEVGTNVGFFSVAKFMRNAPPEGYSVAAVEEIAEETVETYETWTGENTLPAGSEQPVNIIAIMNEAWADHRYVSEFETDEEVMPFYDSMKENTVKGFTLVNIFGGGTAKTEYEYLTGNSVKQYPGMVPFVSYYTHDQYSMVSTLKSQGYAAYAMHPNKGTNWSRDTAYNFLQFDRFYTIDDYDQSEENLLRGMVSDKADYDKIIEVVEEKENPDDKLFIFNVTMQNHGGYTNYDPFIDIKGYDEDPNEAEAYLSLARISDDALKYLIEYFEDCDEPTMIVMFGDHYPGLPESFEEFLSGEKRKDLGLEERMHYYTTPFFIWTNYESNEEENVLTSTNFLGVMTLEEAGVDMSGFEEYVSMFRDEIPAYNFKGYYDNDGKFTKWTKAPQEVLDKVQDYEYLQYNALMEDSGRVDWFFEVDNS